MKRTMATMAAVVTLAGCVLGPTDDAIVTSTTSTLPFEGYVLEANAPVNVRAWNFASNAMEDVGPQVRSGTSPLNVSGGPLFAWSAPRVLPAAFWRPGPAGGHCAAVGARTLSGTTNFNLITVENDWGRCWNENPTVGGFYNECQADNSPVAKLYTTSWGDVSVNQATLNLAAAVASGQISMTFDNFTPVQGAFCNAANPAGCPPGLSADPETYQFYQPLASSITQSGQPPLTFSITPTRQSPLTVYIDDLRSDRLTFTTSGDRFVLGINFEERDPEIRFNCIRDLWCFAYPTTMELPTPRASISFALTVDGGQVTYRDATATFTTSSTDGNAQSAATAIGVAMADKLNNDAAIKAAVAAALDSVLRQTAGLTAFPVSSVTVGGGVVRVRPACPLD
jgi:hypothetical protein